LRCWLPGGTEGANLRRMNPAVLAAIVGVSGTVIVGVAGFGASVWNTRKTIALARESRIWDQRATVYVEVLAGVNYRKRKREFQTRTPPMRDEDRQREQAHLATYQEPDWHELQARLQAFASEPVSKAVRASVDADEYVYDRFEMWQRMVPSAGRQAKEVLGTSLFQARGIADGLDRAVTGLIRAELQDKHPPFGVYPTTFGPPILAPVPSPEGSEPLADAVRISAGQRRWKLLGGKLRHRR
jgi:hypothetical protein